MNKTSVKLIMEVFVGPMNSMDLKKVTIAITVDTRAMPMVAIHPLARNEKSNPPEKEPSIKLPSAEKSEI